MAPGIDNRLSNDLWTAAIGCGCAVVILIVTKSGIAIFFGGLGIVGIILAGIFRAEWLLYVVFLSAIFYTPLERFSGRIDGILIIPMDAIFLVMTIVLLIKSIGFQRPASSPDMSRPLKRGLGLSEVVTGIFLLIFSIAAMVGFFRYHYWQTILTEAKEGLYFGAIPLIADLLGKRRIRLETFLLFIVLASSLGCVYDLYARIYHVYTVSAFTGGAAGAVSYADTAAGQIVRDYGWGGTFVYQVFCVLISFTFLLLSQGTFQRLGWLLLLTINLLTSLLTVTRGFMVGLLVGLAAVIGLSTLGALGSRRVSRGKLIGRTTAAVVVLVGLVLAMVYVIPQTGAAFERFYGLYDSHYAGRGDKSNMEFRLQSMQTGLSNALEHPLGVGFGYMSPSSSLSEKQSRMRELVYHNSLGFMLYKFGFPGAITVIGIFVILAFMLFRIIRKGNEADKRASICLVSSLMALVSMSFTSTNYIFDHSSLSPFVIFVISGSISLIEHPSVDGKSL